MKSYDAIAVFGQNIRKLRAANCLTKKEMAKRLGIGIGSLSMIEKGILPKRLSCDVLDNIAAAFGVGPYQIFLPLEDLPPEG